MNYWVGVTKPRCKRTGLVLRQQRLAFEYVLHTHCLDCDNCKQWIGTSSDVDVETVDVIRKESNCEIHPARTEAKVHAAVLQIINRKKRVMKKKVRQMACEMLDWRQERIWLLERE